METLKDKENSTPQKESEKVKSSYQITIDRILRSNSLFEHLSNEKNSCDFKESKALKSFFDKLDKRKISEKDKEKILWTIFVYFNQLKRL